MDEITLAELAASVGGIVEGDSGLRIARPCPPNEAGGELDLAVAVNAAQRRMLPASRARAAVLSSSADLEVSRVGWSHHSLAGQDRACSHYGSIRTEVRGPRGIHPTAVIDPDAEIGRDVSIGAFTVIGKGVEICEGVCMLGATTIGEKSRVGRGSVIHPGVRIGWGVSIGMRAIVHANACIGSDGFSFVPPDPERVQRAKAGRTGRWRRRPNTAHSLAWRHPDW